MFGSLRVKGYTDLIAPKYPLAGDQLMSYRTSSTIYKQPKLILSYTYKRTQAGSPGIENNIGLKWLAPGTQTFAHSKKDLKYQPQLTSGLILKLHDIFPVIQTQVCHIFSLHMVTLTVLRQDTHHLTANNQITEFKIPYTTYKNPTIGTICHTTHKET